MSIILSHGKVNTFNLAKNAAMSVEQNGVPTPSTFEL
jgi:hypothetical protein